MTNDWKRLSVRVASAWLLMLAAALSHAAPVAPARPDERLRAEDVLAKHLESVGSEETRKSIKTRIVQGRADVVFRAPTMGQAAGRVVMASQGEKHLVAMAFDNQGYSQEKIGFDGEDATVGFIKPGQRSNLGDFILTHKNILRHGLFGGVLSQAWPLFGPMDKKAKLEYAGTKKLGARQAHELKYTPRGGSDLRVSLFFDAETFRHVRTEYTRVISAQMTNNPEASAGQRESRYKMVEEFSDFKQEGGLTLPHAYAIKLDLDTRAATFRAEWLMQLSQFAYNQPLDPASFNMGSE